MSAMSEGSSSVLVLVTDYPGGGSTWAHRFVHVRNLYYRYCGIDLMVLSFSAKKSYKYEGIQVITLKDYLNSNRNYDLLVSHQPNIRQHYRFVTRYGDRFPRFIMFFHGHEVLRFRDAYPAPYAYTRKFFASALLRDCYDSIKLSIWRRYIPTIAAKTFFVFVSEWMLDEFLKATCLAIEDLQGRYQITYNCVGEAFQEGTYEPKTPKDYDFVTVRSNLDGSKYCIDVVTRLAFTNPGLRFLVVGKGRFFEHTVVPENLEWQNRTLDHGEIVEVLQRSRCALMPTRTDAQGLMTCEMASFCMPVITSDIPACHEALDGFENVRMIDNRDANVDLRGILEELEWGIPYEKDDRYFNCNTSAREVDVIERMLGEVSDAAHDV